jgi:hypothetical protein
MDEFYCTCYSFKKAGYPCKHMFACMVKIENENEFDETILEDPFLLIKKTRLHLSNCVEFTKLINNQEFPVTIGISAFRDKIMDKMVK